MCSSFPPLHTFREPLNLVFVLPICSLCFVYIERYIVFSIYVCVCVYIYIYIYSVHVSKTLFKWLFFCNLNLFSFSVMICEIQPLHYFPRATVTSCYKLDVLKQKKFILSQFWELEAVIKVSSGLFLPQDTKEESVHSLPLPTSHSFRHSLVRGCITAVSVSTFTWPSVLCLCHWI